MGITVCVPSYNRGHLALEHIRWMEERIPEARFFVLDNASFENTEGYGVLSLDPRVRYIRLDRNTGIDGAFNACVENNTGVIVYCSDEDVITPEGYEFFSRVEWDKVSLARGSSKPMEGAKNSDAYPLTKHRFSKGTDAVVNYAFGHSYMTGAAYNLSLIDTRLYLQHVFKYHAYMIFWLDLLSAIGGDIVTTDEVCAELGSAAENADSFEKMTWTRPYSYGSRIDEHVGMRDMLLHAVNATGDLALFKMGYLKAAYWSYRMVHQVNAFMYQGIAGIERQAASRAMREVVLGCLEPLNIPEGLKKEMKADLEKVYRDTKESK